MSVHPATPAEAALSAEQVRTSNLLVDSVRLDTVLDALIEGEGFEKTVARVQRALATQAERRRVEGWVA